MREPTNAVECLELVYRIRNRTILDNVTFSIKQGQIAGLLGPNGAGKSSLIRILSGLTPAHEGVVRILGNDAGPSMLPQIALLPDRGKLPSWVTSTEWLRLAASIYPDWDAVRADSLLDALEVRLHRRISALSRGEEARLQLLTCLARTAKVVILDEPFTGVDLLSREKIASSVVADLADGEKTFLIATHDIRELEGLFDRVVYIGEGRILSVDDADDLREFGHSVESRYREVFA